MNYIYKITNKINGKVYIGLTTQTIEKRWGGHLQSAKNNEKHLYKSMRKYGIENFTIEEIDRTENFEELGLLERKYIKEYDSTNPDKGYNNSHGGESNQLDGNPRARLTVEDIEEIRQIYSECAIGPLELWERYKDRVSYDAFEKVYEGTTWRSIMSEVYTEDNKIAHKSMGGQKGAGEKNANALYTNEEVYEIRQYYVNHSLRECYEKYGAKSKSKDGFRALIDRGYIDVPVYKKNEKRWINCRGEVENVRNVKDKNEVRCFDDYAEIDTYNAHGDIIATFIIDLDMVKFIKTQKWRCQSTNNIKRLQGDGGKYYHRILLNGLKNHVIYKDGNCLNLRRNNLTTMEEILTYDNLKKLYIEQGLTMIDISKKLHFSREKISTVIKEFGLEK